MIAASQLQILRADVQAKVDRHVATTPPQSERERWERYEAFKRALSFCCGWDATESDYDQEQYDTGMQEYLRRLEL